MLASHRKVAIVVFVVSTAGLSLFAWERLKEPSPHFHFVDMAYSFLKGRLDTDAPRKSVADAENDPNAPRGYAAAVRRQIQNPDGSVRGWNDFASYRILTMKNGEVLRGVFPWRDQPNDARKNDFHALDGTLYRVDCARDVKSGCWGNGENDVKFYISFPPFPAVLMMPLVAIWQYATNDVWFTLFFGGLNGALLFLLLEWLARTGKSHRSRSDNLWLTAMFVFGTVHCFSAVRGEVWFTALIVGVSLNLAFIWCTLADRRPIVTGLFAGLFLGLGVATRTPLEFAVVLMALVTALPDGRLPPRDAWGQVLGRLTAFAVPVAGILAALMAYNLARFGSPMEFGHTYLQEGQRPAIREHGLMSGWFLGPNLSAALINPPVITFESAPWIRITRHGLGLLWTTPALFLVLGSPRKTWLFRALLATAFVVSLPGLFYQNTGWEQFGYRFGLDWLPFVVVAFAIGDRPLTWRVKALIAVGIVVNVFGAITFGRANGYYY